jgi:hypothetical protein
MNTRIPFLIAALLLSTLNLPLATCFAFEGRITATITQANQSQGLLYTVGTNFLRMELTATNAPNPVDVLDRNSGELTLLFPHNRSFMRLKSTAENVAASFPVMPGMSGMPLPAGIGPQPQNQSGSTPPPTTPAMPGPPGGMPQMPAMPNMPATGGMSAMPQMPNTPGASGMPALPAMPMMPMPMEKLELKATGEKTNLLGLACVRYELKQRGETMEIWATDQLFPYQPYVLNQPNRFGPRMIEEQWAALVTAKKLFPLLASLHPERGPERYRFEVQAINPQPLNDADLKLFQPPDGYFEIQPLPF